ncbi:MAG TPA: hypothetical protein VFY20_07280 [Gemmatimonadales bacterium]|nr:hypothetical protein [Gemmatimonadales bacterium]
MGRQCHALDVILRVGALDEDRTWLDDHGTWLLGHTERIEFGETGDSRGQVYAMATLHVPCRHYREPAPGAASCAAHAFRGKSPRRPVRAAQPRRFGEDRFLVFEEKRLVPRTLRRAPRELRVLPQSNDRNPCDGAPCRTPDQRRGAACCRNLWIELMCTPREKRLEALVRARRSPQVSYVTRVGASSLELQVISACGYLEPGSSACTLHGRAHADGRSAKPGVCVEWPAADGWTHTGCVFAAAPASGTATRALMDGTRA